MTSGYGNVCTNMYSELILYDSVCFSVCVVDIVSTSSHYPPLDTGEYTELYRPHMKSIVKANYTVVETLWN